MDRTNTPLEVVRVLAPIVLSLIGAVAIWGVAATDIRERYQLAADLLVWSAVPCLIASMIAVVYPFAIQRPTRAIRRQLMDWRKERRQRRIFYEWIGHWGDFTSMLLTASKNIRNGTAEPKPAQYEALRSWFIQHEPLLPADLKGVVIATLLAQWSSSSPMEQKFRDSGFFHFYRFPDFVRQVIVSEIELEKARRLDHTLSGIWDGLTRYAAGRGWPPIKAWASLQSHLEQAQTERALHP